MAKKKKTIIHVNQIIVRKNKKTGSREPVLTVKSGKSNNYAHEVYIDGPSRVVYSPDKPLPSGAVCWIETEAGVAEIVYSNPSLLGGRGEPPKAYP